LSAHSAPKKIGMYIALLICETLGLQLSVSIAPDFAERMAHRLERRRLSRKQVSRQASKKKKLVHRSRLGDIARGRKLSAGRLSEIARDAINARRQRHRQDKQRAEKKKRPLSHERPLPLVPQPPVRESNPIEICEIR
jgi:hypothetical protein